MLVHPRKNKCDIGRHLVEGQVYQDLWSELITLWAINNRHKIAEFPYKILVLLWCNFGILWYHILSWEHLLCLSLLGVFKLHFYVTGHHISEISLNLRKLLRHWTLLYLLKIMTTLEVGGNTFFIMRYK